MARSRTPQRAQYEASRQTKIYPIEQPILFDLAALSGGRHKGFGFLVICINGDTQTLWGFAPTSYHPVAGQRLPQTISGHLIGPWENGVKCMLNRHPYGELNLRDLTLTTRSRSFDQRGH